MWRSQGFLDDVENAGLCTNLIRNRLPVGGLKKKAIKGSIGYINFVRTALSMRNESVEEFLCEWLD
jgi:hypothetical protein